MNITADTNVLVRAVVGDDAVQASRAVSILTKATLIAVTLPTLCEFVWVLCRVYDFRSADISRAVRALMAALNVTANHHAVEAGLLMLEAGGDFADGVIGFEGSWLGGETFVSFDKKAVALFQAQGVSALLL